MWQTSSNELDVLVKNEKVLKQGNYLQSKLLSRQIMVSEMWGFHTIHNHS